MGEGELEFGGWVGGGRGGGGGGGTGGGAGGEGWGGGDDEFAPLRGGGGGGGFAEGGGAGGGGDGRGARGGGRGDGLEGVDGEGIEEFVGEYEGRIVGVWGMVGFWTVYCRRGMGGDVPLGTNRISSHHITGASKYLPILR